MLLGTKAFQFNERGRKRDTSELLGLPSTRQLRGMSIEKRIKALDEILDRAGVDRPVRAFTEDGKIPWGVEMRSVPLGRGWLVYLINMRSEPVRIRLCFPRKPRRLTDLITGQEFPLPMLELRPLAVKLLRTE